MRSDDKVSAVEARLQKDIKNLKREKEVLSEDIEVIVVKFQMFIMCYSLNVDDMLNVEN